MDKNNQGSEEIVVSERTSTMAYWVVLLTSLPWIGAFMLQRKKTAIKMLLIQIALVVAHGCYVFLLDPIYDLSAGLFINAIFALLLVLSWLGVWLWGLVLTRKVALANDVLNVKDIDKNNQTSEEILVSERTSMMAFFVVFLTSLSWIGAFMLQRKKTAIKMLLIQIFVVYSFYDAHHGSHSGGAGLAVGVALVLFVIPLWLGTWLWGLILTAKVALAHNKSNLTARKGIIIATLLSPFFIILWLLLLS